ncbi:MAG: IS30 family transposase [Hyphomicrobiaceae bacterium]|nr:IS30 family transposase [Hyphomicrobiaceae bacterium]
MPKGYHHLTCDQRCQIYALLKSGLSHASIARQLNIHRSTLTREIHRNSGKSGYRYKQAHEKATTRRHKASAVARKMTPPLLWIIERKLTHEQWSPDQISGWLGRRGGLSVSHEWIYQHIWGDKKAGGTLWTHLRRRGKKYNRRGAKTAGRGLIPGRTDIDKRPQIVEEKTRIGDWEGDTIIGKNHKGAIFSCVDRMSKFTKLSLLPDKCAKSVESACERVLWPIAEHIKTITFDNGKEFAGHARIDKMLGSSTYFAKPYHSWQRGLNEHTNGLVRQYFPKGTDFSKLTPGEVQKVEDKLNNRPRKILNYKTPREVFSNGSKKTVALQC